MDEDSLLKGLLGLLTSLTFGLAEDELGLEGPGLGDLPLADDLLVDEGVVVLEAGSESLSLKGGPDCIGVSCEIFLY